MSYLELTCRTAVWAVFLAAAAGKASPAALRGFASSLAVRWLPARLSTPAAVAVIAAEAATVAALSTQRARGVGYGLAIAALVTFTAVAAGAMRRGERLRCRCFGADAGPIGGSQLLRNCVLIAIAIAGLGIRLAGPGTATWPVPAMTATAIATGLAVAVAVVRWDDLAYLFAPLQRRRIS